MALSYLKSDPSTPPKQVSRLCQKLMDTSLSLSIKARRKTERKQHANQAREYAEKAVENARKADDDCMLAQAEFMMACVSAWKIYVEEGALARQEVAEVMLGQKLDELRKFEHLDLSNYEDQARKYLGLLRKL
jgi:hypothetical protein